MTRLMQPSFGAGELAPSFAGRVDLPKYHVGARLLRNMVTHPHGGVSNRAGTKHMNKVQGLLINEDAARLIPFEFSVEQAYMLEFSNQRMRVIFKDAGYVLNPLTDGTRYKWTLSGFGTAEYYLELAAGGDPLIPNPIHDMQEDGTEMVVGNAGTLSPNEWDVTDNDGLGYTTVYVRLLDDTDPDTKATGYITTTFQAVSPFKKIDDLTKIRYTQSADTVYFAHSSYAPQKLTRTLHYEWTFSALTFAPGVAAPPLPTSVVYTGPAPGANTRDWKYKLAVIEDGEESLPSAGAVLLTLDRDFPAAGLVTVTMPVFPTGDTVVIYKNIRGTYGFVGSVPVGTATWLDDGVDPDETQGPQEANNPFAAPGDYPGAVGIHPQQRLTYGRTNNQPQTIFGSQTGFLENFSTSFPLRDTDALEVTIANRQVNEIRHLHPIDQMLVFTSGAEWLFQGATAEAALTPTSVSFRPQEYRGISDSAEPLSVGKSVLYVQREGKVVRDLTFALEVDGYQGNDLTVLASHLFKNRTIVAWAYQQDPDSIIWAVMSDGALLGFTYVRDQQVWAWTRHDTDGFFEDVAAIPGDDGTEVYFVVKRDIDGFTSRFVERLTDRLPNGKLEASIHMDATASWDDPKTIISTYVDGGFPTRLGLVTSAAHGFSDGDKIRVTDVVGIEVEGLLDLNDKYFLVGADLSDRFFLRYLGGDFVDNTGLAPYVSGGEIRKAVSTVSGLDHLEGKTVVALADGNVIRDLVVASGSVTLTEAYSWIHVGLPYVAQVETMSLDLSTQEGTTQGKEKVINQAVFRLEDTRGVWFGPDSTRLDEMKLREFEGFGDPTSLFTGDKVLPFQPNWNRDGRIFIEQPDPVPMTILAVIPEVTAGE